jgi:hypothetical protein
LKCQAEKILEDLCRVAMTREDMTQMDLELAKMEGTTVTGTPAHHRLQHLTDEGVHQIYFILLQNYYFYYIKFCHKIQSINVYLHQQ